MTPGAAAPTLHKGASPRQSLHNTTGGQGGVAGWPWSVTGQENVNLFFFSFKMATVAFITTYQFGQEITFP